MSSYGRVLAASLRVLAARSKPAYYFSFKPLSNSLKVCLGTPLEFVFTLDHECFFLRNDKCGQEMKISSKCPTSSIASPHVKYVKGC